MPNVTRGIRGRAVSGNGVHRGTGFRMGWVQEWWADSNSSTIFWIFFGGQGFEHKGNEDILGMWTADDKLPHVYDVTMVPIPAIGYWNLGWSTMIHQCPTTSFIPHPAVTSTNYGYLDLIIVQLTQLCSMVSGLLSNSQNMPEATYHYYSSCEESYHPVIHAQCTSSRIQ